MIICEIYPVGLWSAPQLFFRLSGEESAKDLEICVAQVGFRINIIIIIIINIIIIIIIVIIIIIIITISRVILGSYRTN